MKSICSRCNKEVDSLQLIEQICKRCQDVLEFGYQSFDAYPLEQNKEKVLISK